MEILIILLVTTAAIGALVALNAWLGGWTPSSIQSIDDALERMRNDYLDFEPGEAVMAADRKTALIIEASGDRIGFIAAQGDILVPRLLDPDEIGEVKQDRETLRLSIRDFTFPGGILVLSSLDEAVIWRNRLTAIRDKRHA